MLTTRPLGTQGLSVSAIGVLCIWSRVDDVLRKTGPSCLATSS